MDSADRRGGGNHGGGGGTLQVMKVLDEAAGEVRLYCHSPGRARKEAGITGRLRERFEAGLAKLAEGLATPRGRGGGVLNMGYGAGIR